MLLVPTVKVPGGIFHYRDRNKWITRPWGLLGTRQIKVTDRQRAKFFPTNSVRDKSFIREANGIIRKET